MMRAGNFILKYSKALLENKQQAILYTAILSIMPFASWLSIALVSLLTLRKGAKAGFEVMLPALVVHSVPLIILVPLESALINTLVAYLPCYFAAICLRKTTSWQMVSGVFLFLAFIGFTLIQLLIPDFAINQFDQFKNILSQYQDYQQLVENGIDGISSLILAQLFLGIQILSVIVSAVISLMLARSVQAGLFIPDGFKNEMSEFRGGKLSFLILIAVSTATYYEISFAINLLPLILCYFLICGFNLAYFILARKNPIRIFILLFLLILLKPSFVLLTYIVFGSLDSLFNFRLYLPKRVREST